jgi:inositol oxygenase
MNYRDYNIYDNMSKKQRDKINIIRNTYRQQREKIDYDFNTYLKNKYLQFTGKTNFWSLFASLDNIIDLSDPDTSLPNSIHALQTAEAIRKQNKYPDWMELCGLIHDMGKILYLSGNNEDGTSKSTQWSIVGDTFITGCTIPNDIVLSEFNELNKDHNKVNKYNNNCGLTNCNVSFGHDEYMYHLLKRNKHKMPAEAEYIIRYHSLYLYHSSNSYDYLLDNEDIKMKAVVKDFNQYDLYSKNDNLPIKWTYELREYYTNLVKKYISENMIIYY